jgi:Protein of unknown function (DUF2793)
MANTPHLGLPLLAAAQAQKHITHNEALTLLDALTQLSAKSRTTTTPPASPAEGEAYIVPASGAVGAWSAHAGKIALYTGGLWTYLTPKEGWRAWIEDLNELYIFSNSAWTAFSNTLSTLDDLIAIGIGTTPDSTNKLAVKSKSALFAAPGTGTDNGNARLTVSKAALSNTASLVFQNNYAGRAEIGLTGDDKLSFKTTTDGTNWRAPLIINPATGSTQLTSINEGPLAGFRNFLINGRIDIWQRGTSFTTSTYTADRMCILIGGGRTHTTARSTDVPSGEGGFQYAMQCVVGGAAPASGGFIILRQPIEAKGQLIGRTMTLSVWVKGPVDGTFAMSVYDNGISMFTSAGTWQRYSITITLTDPYPSLSHIFADIWRDASDGTWLITGAQLEYGALATPFEQRPPAIEWTLCQRYYEIVGRGTVGAIDTPTHVYMGGIFKVMKRASPTLSIISGTHEFYEPAVAINTITPTLSASTVTLSGYLAYVGGLTGRALQSVLVANSDYLAADAEM